eukprot:CAMPEP_0180819860 /NCGR_PEP_ID=MMETSP1038_2-20121128/69966_1 /TAXON_ID=632150 /ORGANISM="Azadinium spinosum, Strain 3D9" /LENGTH=43 /DNA_ID= /DNA_START= /DNA_END= /DNA_ORIENTATION=
MPRCCMSKTKDKLNSHSPASSHALLAAARLASSGSKQLALISS